MSEESGNKKEERVVWSGHPDHIIHIHIYVLCALTFWLVVPIFYALYIWYRNQSTKYEITTERLFMSSGVFSRITEQCELYRIKDITVGEPFLLRLVGLSNIKLITSDKGQPEQVLLAVKNGRGLSDIIRRLVEHRRDVKGVTEIDGL